MKENPERLLKEKPIDTFANGFAALVNAKLGGSTSTLHVKVLHATDAAWKELGTAARRMGVDVKEWDEEVCLPVVLLAPSSSNASEGKKLLPVTEHERYAKLHEMFPEASEKLIRVLAAFDVIIYLHNSRLKDWERRLVGSGWSDSTIGLTGVGIKCARVVTDVYGRSLDRQQFSDWFDEYLRELEKTEWYQKYIAEVRGDLQ